MNTIYILFVLWGSGGAGYVNTPRAIVAVEYNNAKSCDDAAKAVYEISNKSVKAVCTAKGPATK